MYIGNQAAQQTAGYGGAGVMSNAQSAQTAAKYQGETAARRTEVDSEMERLAEALDQAGVLLDTLIVRLEPVLRQTGALAGNKDPSQPEPVLCKLANQIRNRRQATENLNGMLQRLVSDLEV